MDEAMAKAVDIGESDVSHVAFIIPLLLSFGL